MAGVELSKSVAFKWYASGMYYRLNNVDDGKIQVTVCVCVCLYKSVLLIDWCTYVMYVFSISLFHSVPWSCYMHVPLLSYLCMFRRCSLFCFMAAFIHINNIRLQWNTKLLTEDKKYWPEDEGSSLWPLYHNDVCIVCITNYTDTPPQSTIQ